MGWDGPILTDSGGFQVFSLADRTTIDEQGVVFRSHIDGARIELSPERSIAVQEKLGSDVAMQLDHVVALPNDREVIADAMRRSVRWAERCRAAATRTDQTLFAIVQGGLDAELRAESAEKLVAMDFAGYAIGGLSVGETPEEMYADARRHAAPSAARPAAIPDGRRPADDLLEAIARGVDLFDCVMPTRNGRNALAFTDRGPVRLRNQQHALDREPLEPDCPCPACRHSRGYLRHLFQANEMLGPILLSIHNLTYYQRLLAGARAGDRRRPVRGVLRGAKTGLELAEAGDRGDQLSTEREWLSCSPDLRFLLLPAPALARCGASPYDDELIVARRWPGAARASGRFCSSTLPADPSRSDSIAVFAFVQQALAARSGCCQRRRSDPNALFRMMMPLVIIFALFYFLMIRPQKKKEEEFRKLVADLKENDHVVTIGGIHGVVTNVQRDADRVTIRVDDSTGTKLRINASAIARVVTDEGSSNGSVDRRKIKINQARMSPAAGHDGLRRCGKDLIRIIMSTTGSCHSAAAMWKSAPLGVVADVRAGRCCWPSPLSSALGTGRGHGSPGRICRRRTTAGRRHHDGGDSCDRTRDEVRRRNCRLPLRPPTDEPTAHCSRVQTLPTLRRRKAADAGRLIAASRGAPRRLQHAARVLRPDHRRSVRAAGDRRQLARLLAPDAGLRLENQPRARHARGVDRDRLARRIQVRPRSRGRHHAHLRTG